MNSWKVGYADLETGKKADKDTATVCKVDATEVKLTMVECDVWGWGCQTMWLQSLLSQPV